MTKVKLGHYPTMRPLDRFIGLVSSGLGGSCPVNRMVAFQLCRLTCVERLESIVENEVVAIDDRNGILAEYANHLNHSGEPGVGDVFFRHVHNNQYASDRVLRVAVTPSEDDRRGFEELPENTLDRSDRKFLAVAVVANATILNAVDSDWAEQATLTDGLGVRVTQLCPQHASRRA